MSSYNSETDIKSLIESAFLDNSGQIAKQVAQAISQNIAAGKSSFIENKAEEINAGEAHRSGVLSLTRAWNNEDLGVKQRSNDTANALANLHLREAEHAFRIQRQLDHENVRGARNAVTNDNQLHTEYAKFNAAVSEPIAPNTQDSGSDTKGGDQA